MAGTRRSTGTLRCWAVVGLATVCVVLGAACTPEDGRPTLGASSASAGEQPLRSPSTPSSTVSSDATTAEAIPAPRATEDPDVVVALVAQPVAEVPHDTDAFTQGLELVDGRLYESTGERGESTVREVDPDTGEVLRSAALEDRYFGEGLTAVGDTLVQITWQEGTAFVYDRETFDVLTTHEYDGDGWGLCHDGERLVMSDGSARLTFRDPDSFAITGSVEVTIDGQPQESLNELECVDGDVWANVWKTNTILRIDPVTGVVTATVDASGLLQPRPGDVDVLNGIAYDEESGRFLLTGKDWPTMYEVDLVPVG